MKILSVNAGSSTIKCNLYEYGSLDCLWEGMLDWKTPGHPPEMRISYKDRKNLNGILTVNDREEAFKELINSLISAPQKLLKTLSEVTLVGHRVVHGGERYVKPVLITDEVKEEIRNLIDLAPLHNPVNLNSIELTEKLLPKVPQVAVFDTSFHRTMKEEAYTYPIPIDFSLKGIKRYGFHGINHEYCSKKALSLLHMNPLSTKMVTCHLGNGASLAAIKEGKCIDTTMGFTPLEGLMMGTRPGSIDPGILLYLLQKGMALEELTKCLNEESGLKGISKAYSDMRSILTEKQKGNRLAELAFNMYVHIFKKQLGGMIAALEGLDILVFTGGIGENVPLIRQQIADSLSYLNLSLDASLNLSCRSDSIISSSNSRIKALVIHAKENLAIAECAKSISSALS